MGDVDPRSEEREGLPEKERPPKGEGLLKGGAAKRGGATVTVTILKAEH